jgi:hypothetical protein
MHKGYGPGSCMMCDVRLFVDIHRKELKCAFCCTKIFVCIHTCIDWLIMLIYSTSKVMKDTVFTLCT